MGDEGLWEQASGRAATLPVEQPPGAGLPSARQAGAGLEVQDLSR